MNFQTLNDILPHHAARQPDTVACGASDRGYSFGALERRVNRVGNALLGLGIRPGDRVACLTKHHVECLMLSLAACKIGAVCMPVNWRLSAQEFEYIVNNGEARFLMADASFLPLVQQAKLPGVLQTVCTERGNGAIPGFDAWYGAADDRLEAAPAGPGDAALQLYSSGTTGLPKGVVLSHRALLSTCITCAAEWRFDGACILGNPLPTFHVAGMAMMLLPLFAGGRLVAFPEFDASAFIDSIGRDGITHTFIVPAMLQFMLNVPNVEHGDYQGLRQIAYGGSPISERVLQEAMRMFQCGFLQVYGLTEVAGPAAFLRPEDHQPGGDRSYLLRSAGQPVGGARLRIVDPGTLRDAPDGEVGEIWIETIRNFSEYWRNPEATSEAFPAGRTAAGGWFRSGDAGYLKDGYLFIHDRVKDMIISGGENVYPAEVENVVMQHPAVADCAVFAVPDETWGEAVKVAVVVRAGGALTESELIGFARERLAHYKCPKSVDFAEALPRNPTGKLLKRVLRQPYWAGRDRLVS
ncbi:long-chain-fatty-acid--CoA ligase [Pseudoduganella namucuonensis]|uniref:Acyl-CoA synthetase (AMP-forming)/AMP-acid ligase II n=1 Tax=Pseudoduganella namucuonensis TaxID=1035707 RepID=A0A1I7LRT2_9BURK|nr:long-chain-fatty-acid--CoA ligase [Pseudoduganella namucuonensis]SFV12391.1 Acyl-CoA synthetase (AMP-forming)/AMP-acid ligase II [Pseudoduganella namucuonensis]